MTVHADQALARVPGAPIGSNDWDSDRNITNPGTGALLDAAGVRVLELNTGPFDDVCRRQTDTWAVDPSIEVGVEISPFGPDSGRPDRNGPLLKAAGSAIDVVDDRWYRHPFGGTSDAALFGVPRQIPAEMASIKAGIAQNAGANAGHIQVVVGETNTAGFDPGVQGVTVRSA